MALTPYPQDFYVAHRLFTGKPFSWSGVWGDITDGPVDRSGIREALADQFRDEAPTLSNLRVWHFPGDAAPRDVTEDCIADFSDLWADLAA